MQGTVVAVLMALAGLGCYNKEDHEIDPAPLDSASGIKALPNPSTDAVAPIVYPPPFVGGPPSDGHDLGRPLGQVVHQTIVSFFLGRDDDVMTAKEIESAFYSGAYSSLYDYAPSSVLSPDAPR